MLLLSHMTEAQKLKTALKDLTQFMAKAEAQLKHMHESQTANLINMQMFSVLAGDIFKLISAASNQLIQTTNPKAKFVKAIEDLCAAYIKANWYERSEDSRTNLARFLEFESKFFLYAYTLQRIF